MPFGPLPNHISKITIIIDMAKCVDIIILTIFKIFIWWRKIQKQIITIKKKEIMAITGRVIEVATCAELQQTYEDFQFIIDDGSSDLKLRRDADNVGCATANFTVYKVIGRGNSPIHRELFCFQLAV